MSEYTVQLQKVIDASIQQTEASKKLADDVAKIKPSIDQRMGEAEKEYDQLIANIHSDFPFYRLTRNQELRVNGSLTDGLEGTPDGWVNRAKGIHHCRIVASTESGVEPDKKSPIIQQMWTDIKGGVPKYNQPNFAVVRVSTSPDAEPSSINTFYSLYQGAIPSGIPMTFGGWIKVEQGDVRFLSPNESDRVPDDGKWHEITRSINMSNGGASCLIALPAVVAGKLPKGKWGFINKPILEHQG
ncbi:hypothetical protein [Vibrio cionasavignyae]|uniref:hypothetical protein n=1 Tax=Vibrio cionasavignyae TaxID=2910252 RepID=UPI003D0E93A2